MIAALVPIGTALTLIGLGLLGWCIVSVVRGKRANLPEAEMNARLQRLIAVNLGGVLTAALGLMCLIMGLILS